MAPDRIPVSGAAGSGASAPGRAVAAGTDGGAGDGAVDLAPVVGHDGAGSPRPSPAGR